MSERRKFDPDGDGKVGLENVIYFLQILSGTRAPGFYHFPAWLQEKILGILDSPPANPPVQIFRTVYQSEIAYYIPPRCCDIMSELYDKNGNLICHPGGGFTGQGDFRCPDFLLTPGSECIWHDDRSR